MAPLRIAQVAPLWSSVPPRTYGGIEQVVHALTEGLVARGCAVTLFASGDSRTSAALHATCERHLIAKMRDGEAGEYEAYASAALAEALRRAGAFDLIHCHLGAAYLPFAGLSPAPVLTTVHTALGPDELWALERYPDQPVAALSHAQIAALSPARRRHTHVVYHGCALEPDPGAGVEPARGAAGAGGYLLFLGRMNPRKNPAGAIRVARAAGMPLVLAGEPITDAERQYFDAEVRPLVDGRDVRYAGPVGGRDKPALLAGAAALLFPIRWDEPFGLVMIEAMLCGTPVVACRRGSVCEVVDEGVTGFHAAAEAELAALVPRALALDRRAVRDRARQRFSADRMVADHLVLYGELTARPRP